MPRFLALVSCRDPIDADGIRQAEQAAATAELALSFRTPTCMIFADRATSLDETGIVIGDMFPREPGSPRAALSPPAATIDRWLIVDHWGSYVAFWRDPDGGVIHVLRDPSGALPCLAIPLGTRIVLASDIPLLDSMHPAMASIDWEFVRQLVVYPHLRGRRTGLAGIEELLPGSKLTIDRSGITTAFLWSPWAFTHRTLRIDDATEARDRLRATIVPTVQALLRSTRKPLLELSGGLDSSILAVTMATLGIETCGINLATPDAEGDERRYARLVAERTGLRLIERVVEGPDRLDIARPPLPHLERPGSQAWLQAWEHALVETARHESCDAFISGTGGDNVFCALSSAAPAADLLKLGAPGAALRTVAALGTMHGASHWQVGRYAARMAIRRRYRDAWPRDESFVPGIATLAPPDPHPWLVLPHGTLPGSRAHARSIFATYAHRGGSERDPIAPTILPLLAQPVQELCLRIPSWLWVAGGRDRAVARQAFADLLPAAIAQRRTKGAVDSYCVRLVEQHLAPIREMLVEGHLTDQNLLHRHALARWFDAPRAARDLRYFRILTLLDIEIWVRDWLGPP